MLQAIRIAIKLLNKPARFSDFVKILPKFHLEIWKFEKKVLSLHPKNEVK